jgi:hypothetical protein
MLAAKAYQRTLLVSDLPSKGIKAAAIRGKSTIALSQGNSFAIIANIRINTYADVSYCMNFGEVWKRIIGKH